MFQQLIDFLSFLVAVVGTDCEIIIQCKRLECVHVRLAMVLHSTVDYNDVQCS